ncbi:MAG: hypothetical protein ACLPQS_04300 [Acidimicrobiales bacterium]
MGALTGPVVFDGTEGTSNTSISELESSAPLSITGGELSITSTAFTSTVGGFSMSGGQLGDTNDNQGSLTDTGSLSRAASRCPPAHSCSTVAAHSMAPSRRLR